MKKAQIITLAAVGAAVYFIYSAWRTSQQIKGTTSAANAVTPTNPWQSVTGVQPQANATSLATLDATQNWAYL